MYECVRFNGYCGIAAKNWHVFCLGSWCAYYCKIYLNVLGLDCATRNKKGRKIKNEETDIFNQKSLFEITKKEFMLII